MCATGEGREKGENWCKRAIWLNTLPIIKRIWQSVDNLTSGAFIDMWRERVGSLYALYDKAIPEHLSIFSHQSTRRKRGMSHGGLKHVRRGRPEVRWPLPEWAASETWRDGARVKRANQVRAIRG